MRNLVTGSDVNDANTIEEVCVALQTSLRIVVIRKSLKYARALSKAQVPYVRHEVAIESRY